MQSMAAFDLLSRSRAWRLGAVAVALATLTPLPSRGAQLPACEATQADTAYPAHQMSPKESLKHYDVVFLGEVLVPSRPCSLGFCAGVRVVEPIKGRPAKSVLMQVQRGGRCGPSRFRTRGEKWLVFGHYGTTKAGTAYLSADEDGPTFATNSAPDFDSLEGRYLMMRARLDQAIDERIGATHLR